MTIGTSFVTHVCPDRLEEANRSTCLLLSTFPVESRLARTAHAAKEPNKALVIHSHFFVS